MAKIGYVRVSTSEQNTDLQIQALEQAGCKTIFADEGISGSKKERQGLTEALNSLQEGDSLVVWKIDRLGRSTAHLVLLLDELRERNIEFQSITESIDTSTATGRMVYTMIASFSEMERGNLIERTKAGLQAAKKRGVKLGRPKAMTNEQISHAKTLLKQGMTKAGIARKIGVNYYTLRRSLLS